MTVFQELQRRGLIAQMTHPELIEEKLQNEHVTFYIGFDPTADSLHVGHFLQLTIMARLQKAGHRPIALLGTGTTMIGDPTGKTELRKIMTTDEIDYNAEQFKKQMSRFVDFSDGKALMLRNGDWLRNLNYMEFLRDIGKHFSVNKMLTAECFKTRLERGLSFIEFNYMIMQSYDFLTLYRNVDCTMQMGGNDQWANIIGGVELIRKVEGKEVCGMTFTLLTTKEGKKMGKTESGAVWLDPEKTSPYEFFQYWRNIDDGDVINCLKLLTFVPIEEIEKMEKLTGGQLNSAKEILAFELTKMVHGEEEADKALAASKALFVGGGDSEHMPTTQITDTDFSENGTISVIDILIKSEIASSKGEAKRLIQQGGILVNDVKVTAIDETLTKEQFKDGFIILKKGKKVFHKISL